MRFTSILAGLLLLLCSVSASAFCEGFNSPVDTDVGTETLNVEAVFIPAVSVAFQQSDDTPNTPQTSDFTAVAVFGEVNRPTEKVFTESYAVPRTDHECRQRTDAAAQVNRQDAVEPFTDTPLVIPLR